MNQPIELWNVAAFKNMSSMFIGVLNQPIGAWSVAAATDILGVFAYASALNQPIGNGSCSSLGYVWNVCTGLSFRNPPDSDLMI